MAEVEAAQPSWLKTNWKYIASAIMAAVAVSGWGLHVYQSLKSGEPIPPPPVIDFLDSADASAPPRHYGWTRPAPGDVPDRVFAAPAQVELPPSLHLMAPAPVDAPEPLPFDQGELGSCGANSAAALLLYLEAKAGHKGLPPPSRLFIYYTTRAMMGTIGRDSGVSNATMFRALGQYGWCDESQCPYRIDRFAERPANGAFTQASGRRVTTAEAVPQRVDTLRACLAAQKPIVCGFDVFPSFETRAVELSGVVPLPRRGERVIGGHDVLLVGYDDRRRAFRFLNSYGRSWGDSGFGWLPYEYAGNPQLAGDFWTASASGR